ncbi:hypothetical protein O3W44_22770 [Pantoea sp. LMR881]|uniref:hypothetical protein n=1 Tax=Pantoea sp. LMR881 TaxID=3014336 RepID=UPI0022B05896|nr:hypothetical protein [Pantoea sp. LMR881]MCZ4061358.1 hypothetical protein [Pantoea sp. LMR881]
MGIYFRQLIGRKISGAQFGVEILHNDGSKRSFKGVKYVGLKLHDKAFPPIQKQDTQERQLLVLLIT